MSSFGYYQTYCKPVQICADSIENFGAVLVLLPLVRVELQDRFIH
jgi:hypothetical protein